MRHGGGDELPPGDRHWAEDTTSAGEVSADQLFQWRCRYAYGDHGCESFFETPYGIDRDVVQHGGQWVHTITHKGASADLVIPWLPHPPTS